MRGPHRPRPDQAAVAARAGAHAATARSIGGFRQAHGNEHDQSGLIDRISPPCPAEKPRGAVQTCVLTGSRIRIPTLYRPNILKRQWLHGIAESASRLRNKIQDICKMAALINNVRDPIRDR